MSDTPIDVDVDVPIPEPTEPVMMTLDRAVTILHSRGYWIRAWYPLSDGTFECRITDRPRSDRAWAVAPVALDALRGAMAKAGLFR